MSEACNTLNMDKEPGFTLVELLITIVVITVLLAAGVPAFKDFIKNNRVTAQTNDLISAIQLARSEALKRGSNTVVCASKNQTDCADDKDAWADGWIVFSDVDSDNETNTIGSGKCAETEDCIMSSRKGLPSGSTLTTTTDKVRFLPTGLADNSGVKTNCGGEETTRTVKFTLKAKNCEKSQAREICINQMGRTSVVTVGCN